ncbi:ribonuclease T2-like isoform X2 [Crassostrea virginica]
MCCISFERIILIYVCIFQSIRAQLAKLWPNLNASSNNEQFWKQEWKKHGSCSSLTIEQYFEKAIQLATLYNIYNILEKNSIKPSSKIYYTDKEISESIQKVTGYKPKVHSTKMEDFRMFWDVFMAPLSELFPQMKMNPTT